MIEKICKQCQSTFLIYPSAIKRGGLYCSKRCFGDSKIGKKDINHSIRMKGHRNWNKSRGAKKTIVCIECKTTFDFYPTVYKKRKFCSLKCCYKNRIKNPPDIVHYKRIHSWIRKKLGVPQKCAFCNRTDHINWANKNHKYKYILSDWINLCPKCHYNYDKKYNYDRKLNLT